MNAIISLNAFNYMVFFFFTNSTIVLTGGTLQSEDPFELVLRNMFPVNIVTPSVGCGSDIWQT